VAGALFDDQGVASYRLHRIGDEEHLAVLFPVGDVIPDGPVSVQRRRRPSSAAGR
jgi:hypothetical protein